MRRSFPRIAFWTVVFVVAASVQACPSPTGTSILAPQTGDPVVVVPPAATGLPDPSDKPDGWAGVADVGAPSKSGGYGASTAATYTVRTRSEFLNALKCGGASASDASKIIYVEGMIDLCADGSDKSLSAEDFIAQAGYGASYANYAAYRSAYAASCALGTSTTTLSSARAAMAAKQKAVVIVKVGSNTSILGKGGTAGFKSGSLLIDGKTNVVLRNLSILDAYDYFPTWDGSENLINSEYDNVSVSNSTYVWVDHCALGDGDRPDSAAFSVTIGGSAKKWVTHDGLLDVVRGANYVTVSWNRIENHDKTMLFGNGDGVESDLGKIKVTVHHNYFSGANQRLPRVRFGQVHVYNNYYTNASGYAVGVGDHAAIYSEANYFDGLAKAFSAYDDAANLGYYFDIGSFGVNGDKAMGTAAQVGWKPADRYSYTAAAAESAKTAVLGGAGTGKF